jgi:hypothetical protein
MNFRAKLVMEFLLTQRLSASKTRLWFVDWIKSYSTHPNVGSTNQNTRTGHENKYYTLGMLLLDHLFPLTSYQQLIVHCRQYKHIAVFELMSTDWQLLVNITSIMQLGITVTLKPNLCLFMIGQSTGTSIFSGTLVGACYLIYIWWY